MNNSFYLPQQFISTTISKAKPLPIAWIPYHNIRIRMDLGYNRRQERKWQYSSPNGEYWLFMRNNDKLYFHNENNEKKLIHDDFKYSYYFKFISNNFYYLITKKTVNIYYINHQPRLEIPFNKFGSGLYVSESFKHNDFKFSNNLQFCVVNTYGSITDNYEYLIDTKNELYLHGNKLKFNLSNNNLCIFDSKFDGKYIYGKSYNGLLKIIKLNKWEKIKLLLIGYLKNDYTCPLRRLPMELITYIINMIIDSSIYDIIYEIKKIRPIIEIYYAKTPVIEKEHGDETDGCIEE